MKVYTMSTDTFHGDLTKLESNQFIWCIDNFSSIIMPAGESLRSKVFSYPGPNDFKWQIILYPNNINSKYSKYISIFLKSVIAEWLNIEVPLEWNFVVSSVETVYLDEKMSHVFTEKESDWGYSNKIVRESILSGLKKGAKDTLMVSCRMQSNQEWQKTQVQQNLEKDFGLLLDTKKYSDVVLISNDGIEHSVHKAILSCRSKVFSAMFEHNMKENLENLVKIEDIDSDTLKLMLQFIYTGAINNLQDKSKELFLAAEKYDLDDLKGICIDHLNGSINIDNCLDIFEFVETYNIVELRLKCREYFLNNKKQILSTKGLNSIKNLSRVSIENLLYIAATEDILQQDEDILQKEDISVLSNTDLNVKQT